MRRLILLFALTTAAFAGKGKFFVKDKVFIGGYDPVSYLTEKKAVKGDKKFSHQLVNGPKVYFSSQKNKDLFIKDTKKYTPAYGGYCAWAMAQYGDLVEIDPSKFTVANGKVYLFYYSFFADTLEKWKKGNQTELITKANSNWRKHE